MFTKLFIANLTGGCQAKSGFLRHIKNLRSFSFLLGILKESKISWQPEILSYESPFGVGYLVANLKLRK